jgi:pimeloyl-ACP methyl ester carboxylesterase
MHWAARTNLSIGKHSAWLSDLVFGGPTPTLLERWPALVENTRSLAAPTTDRRVLADRKTIAILNGTIADAMRNGAVGARRDLRLYTHEWGFALDAIRFPVRIWHGQSDGTVPVDHARWYAEHIPSVELTELPNEGHYSVPICYSRQILAELLEPAPEPPSDSSDAAATS